MVRWVALVILVVGGTASAQAPSHWLDRPLTNWNTAAARIPAAPPADETVASVIARCDLKPLGSSTAVRALTAAGWIPFWPFDQRLVRDDVEVVGGMRWADGMCRPGVYNLFVFVGGRFAGALSPVPMTSRLDGSSGAVRVRLPEIAAEFVRYTSDDPLCCPSSRITVRYRIARSPEGPLVVPVEAAITR